MFDSKKIGIFGLGLSGVSTMKYLATKGYRFVAYDDNIATVKKLQETYPELLHRFKDLRNNSWNEIDCLIISPGIPLDHPKPHKVVEIARAAGAEIICDIELFWRVHRDNLFIAITGTNGKSTTSSLVDHILKYNFVDSRLGGNIGLPVLDIKAVNENTVFVIEISSYQLDLLKEAKFDIAAIINISPDHIERHGSFENYKKAKYKIFNNQNKNDVAIINYNLGLMENCYSFSESDARANVAIIDGVLHVNNKMYILPISNSLLGEHNQQNLAAAIAICHKLGISIEKIIEAIPFFKGLKHRMQYLGEVNQIKYVNDSKATNADSTACALFTYENIILILGGVAKEGGVESLKEFFPRIKYALLIGKAQDKFAETLGDQVKWKKCNDLQTAFNFANEIAVKGDSVILSPACASFDQWKNFEERGDAFIKMFESLVS